MGTDLGRETGPLTIDENVDVREVKPGGVAPVAFFVAPVLLVALAVAVSVSGRAAGVRGVVDRVLIHREAAAAASRETSVPLPLILAVVTVESGGRVAARSGRDAVGLMQLRQVAALEMSEGAPVDRRDPETSLRLGARYLRAQLDRFRGRPCAKELALAAYNAGPTRVLSWLRERPLAEDRESLGDWVPFKETRAYVPRVLEWEVYWRKRLGKDDSPADELSEPRR